MLVQSSATSQLYDSSVIILNSFEVKMLSQKADINSDTTRKTTVFKAAILEFSMTVSFLCENVRMGSQA